MNVMRYQKNFFLAIRAARAAEQHQQKPPLLHIIHYKMNMYPSNQKLGSWYTNTGKLYIAVCFLGSLVVVKTRMRVCKSVREGEREKKRKSMRSLFSVSLSLLEYKT